MTTEQGLPWEDDRLIEPLDNEWTVGCRALQTWWRQIVLGLDDYGPHRAKVPDRLVGSMLPLNAPRGSNFYPGVIDEVDFRLDQKGWGGIASRDRLFRNLLSSQPMAFNIFGYLKWQPQALLTWVRSLGIGADEIVDVRIEWAPPKKAHFDGGSAFDAAIFYRSDRCDEGVGLIGVECKYQEDLAQQSLPASGQLNKYLEWTRKSDYWRPGAGDRLCNKSLVQLCLNTLLAQSCVAKGEEADFEGGALRICEATVVMMPLAADRKALEATAAVRSQLVEPEQWLRWSPYEAVIDAVADHREVAEWAAWIRTRYTDFRPVADGLRPDDPRHSRDPVGDAMVRARAEFAGALDDARAMAGRVLGLSDGSGSVLQQIAEGEAVGCSAVEPWTLAHRLAEITEDLRSVREVAQPLHS